MTKAVLFVLLTSCTLIANAQPGLDGSVHVRMTNCCDTTVSLARMRSLPHRTCTIKGHDGERATYEGALLMDVLEVGCPCIRGITKRTMISSAVRITAMDGYSALIALTEADTAFRDEPVLLVWAKNGAPLDAHDGPLQLMVPDDRHFARDARQVRMLEVVTP